MGDVAVGIVQGFFVNPYPYIIFVHIFHSVRVYKVSWFLVVGWFAVNLPTNCGFLAFSATKSVLMVYKTCINYSQIPVQRGYATVVVPDLPNPLERFQRQFSPPHPLSLKQGCAGMMTGWLVGG